MTLSSLSKRTHPKNQYFSFVKRVDCVRDARNSASICVKNLRISQTCYCAVSDVGPFSEIGRLSESPSLFLCTMCVTILLLFYNLLLKRGNKNFLLFKCATKNVAILFKVCSTINDFDKKMYTIQEILFYFQFLMI